MKRFFVIVMAVVSFTNFASDLSNVNVMKKNVQLKVAEVEMKTTCEEIRDLSSDPDYINYDCKVGTIQSKIRKEFKDAEIVSIKGMNNISSDVMGNNVDDEGEYSIKLRVLYY